MEAGAGAVEKGEGSAKKQCHVRVEKTAGKVRQNLNLQLQFDSGLCHTIFSIVVKSLGFETI